MNWSESNLSQDRSRIIKSVRRRRRRAGCCRWDNNNNNNNNNNTTFWYYASAPYGMSKESIYDGTRKIVNYAWTGSSQKKFWWLSELLLTCKSFVRFEYRGERLIELFGSWFSSKFPPGLLRFENLLDSLDHVEIMLQLEREFAIEIPDADAEELVTPRKIVRYICDAEDVYDWFYFAC